MNAEDWLNGPTGGEFPAGDEFTRLRAGEILDPYSDEVIGEDWSAPVRLPLPGAYFASGSSTDDNAEVRRQTQTVLQLIIPNPSADVARGDRIDRSGRVWSVVGFPESDTNPWTGWQPTLVVNLEEYKG